MYKTNVFGNPKYCVAQNYVVAESDLLVFRSHVILPLGLDDAFPELRHFN